MLGDIQQTERKTYLNIKDGAVVKRTEAGEERYSFVEGSLEDVTIRQRTFRGEKTPYWYIDLRDGASGELYSLGFPYSSNIFKSIIMALATAEDFRSIMIKPYQQGGYDKAVVYSEGVKLDWISKSLPPVEEVKRGGLSIKDDSKRMEYICSLAEAVRGRLRMPFQPTPSGQQVIK